MTIEEIIIRNFGIYQNPDPIDLRTNKQQPIILFGGLNGGGKTTLLDAILLCLYGPLAKTSNRGNKGYHTYLRDSLNRHTKDDEGFIELTFKHQRDGNQDTFRIRRSWSVRSTVQESMIVEVNGKPDLLLQEDWLNFIDELIPAQVANLFFFDGEKIEQFADLDNAQQLLESALHSLLGLDVLNQLHVDLRTLIQRKKVALKSQAEQIELIGQQEDLEALQEDLSKINKQLSEPRSDLIRVQSNLKKSTGKYKRGGGALYEQRNQLRTAKNNLEQDLQATRLAFVQAAATETPLMLVEDLLHDVVKQADQETEAQQAKLMFSTLSERDQKTLATIEQIAGKDARGTVEKQLASDREKYERVAKKELYLNLSSDGLKQLHKAAGSLSSASLHFKQINERIASIEEVLERTDKKIQAIPDTETIKRLRSQVERWEKEEHKLHAKIALLEEQASSLAYKIDTLQASIFNKMESDLNAKFKREDDRRVVQYAEKAQGTLDALKSQVIDQRVGEIEDLILRSFKQLIRKSKLIGNIKISTEDYSLSLFDTKGLEIHPGRLSAGERQLLAISILWGLAKAAGLPLPVVIDTPLGRLDGEHRNKLLKFYFPKASHQVLILSTDTEIAKNYYAQLKPRIKQSYQIVYDPDKQASDIKSGYQFT